jgi:hypothetical protein
MFRFTFRKAIAAVALGAAALAVAVSAPPAKADGNIGICVSNCATAPPSSGSTTFCVSLDPCPSWFWAGNYLLYGPLVSITSYNFKVLTYWVYGSDRRFIDYFDCYYWMGKYFEGCQWR